MTTTDAITVVFTGPRGYVTDLGPGPFDLVAPDGTVVMALPRYGVWKFDAARDKHQVILTTDDLAEAIATAEADDRH
jgi:hypothetical protein